MPRKARTHRPTRPRPPETRPSARARGYDWRWEQYARDYLLRNPVCAGCGQKAEHVDHVRPMTGPGDPTWYDEENHQPLCRRCHNAKTKRDNRK